MSRKQETGQVFVLAALSMMMLVAITAFCINASYFYYQHQRMQSMVDEQTRLAAGTGCTAIPNSTNDGKLDGGDLTINPVVVTQPFANLSGYCEGFYTKNPRGLFGNMLVFPNKISVHAVAKHGGTSEPSFSMLGLSPAGANAGCSVYFGGSEGIAVTGNIYSDSSHIGSDCGASPSNTPGNGVHYSSGSAYYSFPPAVADPFQITAPSIAGLSEVSPSASPDNTSFTDACGNSVPKKTAYFVPSDPSGIAYLPDIKFPMKISGTSYNDVVMLPYCNSTSKVKSPGIYLVAGDSKHGFALNNGDSITSIDSTIIIEVLTNSFNLNGGTIILQSPDKGDFKGYAMYETTPCSITSTGISAGTVLKVDGLFDLSCTDLKINGGAIDEFDGALIAYSLWFTGDGGSVTFNPPTNFPPRGAFLVQ